MFGFYRAARYVLRPRHSCSPSRSEPHHEGLYGGGVLCLVWGVLLLLSHAATPGLVLIGIGMALMTLAEAFPDGFSHEEEPPPPPERPDAPVPAPLPTPRPLPRSRTAWRPYSTSFLDED